jgi:hypothetical protein
VNANYTVTGRGNGDSISGSLAETAAGSRSGRPADLTLLRANLVSLRVGKITDAEG